MQSARVEASTSMARSGHATSTVSRAPCRRSGQRSAIAAVCSQAMVTKVASMRRGRRAPSEPSHGEAGARGPARRTRGPSAQSIAVPCRHSASSVRTPSRVCEREREPWASRRAPRTKGPIAGPTSSHRRTASSRSSCASRSRRSPRWRPFSCLVSQTRRGPIGGVMLGEPGAVHFPRATRSAPPDCNPPWREKGPFTRHPTAPMG